MLIAQQPAFLVIIMKYAQILDLVQTNWSILRDIIDKIEHNLLHWFIINPDSYMDCYSA